ncbi:MAG: bifunctional precorrin-2 dehydrogenase/sirohydrochlorin ferrochelatase [Desulfarculaceae bacterium]|nr:bifunctional precorrin-2 dehydrogenase/sirohydrochlorin ferrochelatase [Desulfarculaceae bacterium]MCF8073709.1 bifunctional precorrin-2 dehydrogenase/sirohydrochlorin ferrochelatase [Desulfarculaceae bacterium]MCF8101950.1 bifunctional precorrin-2 dehydrogenase/sirohydrochlorin ferrochelatase [Desulfarculaceae bacterium]MCF8115920.1 bifunctional precorrin-2 dehydrogenase/sirohydrochlorin ferrochelatase [Desulfarculaceae bacterium]
MTFYPALLDLKDRLVLLVGGGRVASRKLASLLAAGARVRLVSPELAPETRELTGDPKVELFSRGFEPADLEGAWLVVCATSDEALNRAVAAAGEQAGVFVNVVDVPPLCSFIVPAVVRRGELTVAVSTGGASPAAARRLRQRLDDEFGPEWGPYLAVLRAARARLTALGRPAAENRPVFYQLVDSELFERVAASDAAGVEAVLARELGPGFSLAELGLSAGDLAPEGRPPK